VAFPSDDLTDDEKHDLPDDVLERSLRPTVPLRPIRRPRRNTDEDTEERS
jgi:hypothetical protein